MVVLVAAARAAAGVVTALPDVVVVALGLWFVYGLLFARAARRDAERLGHDWPPVIAAGVAVGSLPTLVAYLLLRGPQDDDSSEGGDSPESGDSDADDDSPDAAGESEQAREADRLRRGLVSLLDVHVVVLVAFLGAAAVANGAVLLAIVTGLPTEGPVPNTVFTVLQFVGFAVGIAGFLVVRDDWNLIRLPRPSLRDAAIVVGGFVAIFVSAVVVAQLLAAFGVETAQNRVIEVGQENPEFFLYMIPISLLLVGPFEELLFRGLVQELLGRVWTPPVAIVVASTLFGVAHWFALSGGGRLPYIAVAGTLGIVLGVSYETTKNLAVPASIHGIYNAVLFGVQYLAATGVIPGA